MRRIFFVVIFLMVAGCNTVGQTSPFFEPGFQLEGRSAAALSAEWWKWAMSDPTDTNPVGDTTGVHCGNGQQGNVWFLAGGFGSSKIKRNCVIPAGKYIFFPMINAAYWPKENSSYTCEQAKSAATVTNENALNLFVELDGVAMADPKRYRARTDECFNVFERVPSTFHSYNAYPSASDGYWVLLQPLQKGMHIIKFGGQYGNGDMVQDIEYEIFVQ